MDYGFLKAACVTPQVTVADCGKNADYIYKNIEELAKKGVCLAVFPELCITGYTCSDLFFQPVLLDGAQRALKGLLKRTADIDMLFIVGLPVAYRGSLYNCAAACCKGRLLGLSAKTHIPNYGEFYEYRQFASAASLKNAVLAEFAGEKNVALGSDLIFTCKSNPLIKIGVEICEDLWVSDPPSRRLAQAGALIIANPSASNEIIAKARYRKNLVSVQSGRLCCAYLYADCGFGESTTDLVFSGHNIIAENGAVLAESKRFENGAIYTDIDLQRLAFERRRLTTFEGSDEAALREIMFELKPKRAELTREFYQLPFVPASEADRAERCEEILTMQATGLATRLKNTGIKHVVLGLSGGLDSTLALIVCAHAFDMLSLDRKNIHTVTMPCFGTTKRTKSNALRLAAAYGVDYRDINIKRSVKQHFADIGHDIDNHDVTYENSQARERTQVLMDLANSLSALVIGTGDLSELALGWATYNGDHMSMYAVNASIPKTLVKYIVKYEAQTSKAVNACETLLDVLETPVSPELLPPSDNGEISQKTEDIVGPYELHDFFLYYFLRFAYSPKKILYLAQRAFNREYGADVIEKWLRVFIRRFFNQQFKRSCLPDGPKVGSVTLSPRGDWRMPSDASCALWLAELDK